MTTRRHVAWLVGLLMGISGYASAQTATTQTTASSAVTATAQTVTVASATNVTAGSELVIDQEDFVVTSVSSTTATVQRGQGGTRAAAHASGALVWVSAAATAAAPNEAFIDSDPTGTCVAANQPYLPAINRHTGLAWGCPNGTWISYQLSPPGPQTFGRTPVLNANYTALLTDYLIAYTSISSTKTITLPTPTGLAGHVIIVKDEGGNALANTTTLTFSGTVDGAAGSSTRITTAFGVTRLYSDGSTGWFTW